MIPLESEWLESAWLELDRFAIRDSDNRHDAAVHEPNKPAEQHENADEHQRQQPTDHAER